MKQSDEKILELIDCIVAYLQYLNESHSVTVHGMDDHFGKYMHQFLPYNVHVLPYCLNIKSKEKTYRRCCRCQQHAIWHANKGAHIGTCWAGLSEYVFPVPLDKYGKQFGIICVSGYVADSTKTQKLIKSLSKRYNFSETQLQSNMNKWASYVLPPIEEVKRYVQPLSYLLSDIAALIESHWDCLSSENTESKSFFDKVITYVETHYRESITVATLVEKQHCSASLLSHMFRKNTGVSLRQYINMLRLRDSMIYLENTNMTVTEIAHMVGFSDSNYFSTVFTREKGVTPSEYRKKMKYFEHGSNQDRYLVLL